MRTKTRTSTTRDRTVLMVDRPVLTVDPPSVTRQAEAVTRQDAPVPHQDEAVTRQDTPVHAPDLPVPHPRKKVRRRDPNRFRFRKPLAAILDDAARVARFARENWKTVRAKDGTIVRHGLEEACHPLLNEGTADEIERLIGEVQRAQMAFAARQKRPSLQPLCAEAEKRIRELARACEWWATVSGATDLLIVVKRLRVKHRKPGAKDALAAALEDWGRLAREVRGRGGVGERIDGGMLEENDGIVAALRRASPPVDGEAWRAERDGALRMIEATVRAVRLAARLVFQGAPGVLVVDAIFRTHEERPASDQVGSLIEEKGAKSG